MKKFFALFIALFLLTSAQSAFAVSFIGAEELYLDTPSTDDVYAGGGVVTIDEDIEGDLVVGGGSVTINANINGDLFIVGGQITINGDVSDDVRAAGGSIYVNGNIGDDLIVSGGQLNVSGASLIGGSLILGTGYANVLGTINEDIKGGGGKLVLGGTVYRDVEIEIQDSLTLTDSAKINGNLIYTSLRQAELNETQVSGFIEFNKDVVEDKDYGEQIETFFSRFHLLLQFFKYVSMLAVALVMVLLMPAVLLRAAEISIKKPWTNLGIGFIVSICSIAVMIVLAITVIGIPLAGILLGIFLITWYMAKIYAAMFIGRLLIKPKKMTKAKLFGTVALGGFILMVIGIVPIIGWLVSLVILMIGFGTIWSYKKELYDKNHFNKI